MKIVSACLAGVKCHWDGKVKPNQLIVNLVKEGNAIPVCPEQLGGLPTPRVPAEQKGKRVITRDGVDVTSFFDSGAQEALKIANLVKCEVAILKARSPSCGHGKIYDGTFSGKLIKGDGVFAKILKQNGIKVISDEELDY
ncbi:DUF523 domain-containing protein [Candidatus Micrarchaeota archaeon]|nr:DUF523 domain-containing protein [Candidatus Micrarchaeota archaeon]MBU1930613.1 DUF523 domain-containing protein [Candidatus Micrarchaeota archaeon]